MFHSRRLVTTPVTWAVLAVLFVAVLGAAWGTRKLASDQEQKLLRQRTEELGLYVGGLSQTVGAELAPLATAASAGPDPAKSFALAAKLTPAVQGVALIHSNGAGGFTVAASVGPDLTSGKRIGPDLATAAGQAQRAPTSFVISRVYTVNGHKIAAIVSAHGTPPGYLIVQENPVSGQAATSANTTGPYSELAVDLYEGRRAVADQLTLANASPAAFRGARATEAVKIGATDFLLVTAARTALVGSVELNAQWVVLGVGLLLTVMLGVLFELAQRRRDFALELVDQRTGELNRSLETLRLTQDQLVRSERLAAIGELASAVGHELRNPLAVISNALYLVRRASSDSVDPRVVLHLDTADREVSAATLIVSDLLEYSRSREPMMTEVDLTELMEEALSVAPHPPAISVDWQASSEPVTGPVDRDQLRQVFLNLLTNAYDAMPEGGSLVLGVNRESDGNVRINVSDTGTGMEDETRSRIFEPFFTTKARGVGLGLAVTNRIVTAHSGQIEVETKPGTGTTFTVHLPGTHNGTAPGPPR
ncbi:MAG TPA: ATP-binding protein [Acidimicrobiales bacterium]|nr:ATP-binding protein [Acidimicrobiales bacterium]